jgi:hypothetical protein
MWGASANPTRKLETEKPATIKLRASAGQSLCLQNLYVLCLEAFRPLNDVELDCLAFLKAPETVRLNCRKVHEDIFAVLAADKSKSLGVVKPLHCSLFHCVVPFLLF